MAGEWTERLLGDIIQFQSGSPLPESCRRSGLIPVVSSTGQIGTHDTHLATGPGVVTGRKGTIGLVHYIKNDFWPIDTTLYVSGDGFKGNNPRFVSYLLEYLDLSKQTSGTAVPGVNRHHLHKIPVIVSTDINEQRAIAEILGAIDDKIALNQKISFLLEKMARLLYQKQFEDVYTGSEGKVGDLCEINPQSYSKTTLPDRIRYVDIANCKEGNILEIKDLQGKKIPGRARRIVRPGDTIIGTVRPENRSFALVHEDGLTASTGFAVLRPKKSNLAAYLYLAATSDNAVREMSAMANGAAYPVVSASAITSIKIPVPDDAVLDAFAAVATPILQKAGLAAKESRILARLRQTILPEMMSGRLRPEKAAGTEQ
jgi:type I restriction enzyme S subunit